ncbi:MAG: tRNA pseudouridine(55) synthase TruB [Ghiorsea sp.]
MTEATHPCGVIFLDKPKNWTSRKAVNHVIHCFAKPEQKNRKQRPKAGHAGTLDPLATGMLPILIGEATRFTSMGLNAEKCYQVSFDLSFQTDTLDLEGEVLERFDNIDVSQEQLENVLNQFHCVQQQVPPIYSAIKVDGKRAHALARSGEKVELKSREIEVKELELLSFEGSVVSLRVLCTKGTYIRSLARDIGKALLCGGCVTELRRVSSGGWPEQMMVTVEELEEKKEACIIPLQTWLRELPELHLTTADAKRFVQGQRLSIAASVEHNQLCRIVSEGVMLGTATYSQTLKVLQPEKVMPSAQETLK